MIQGGGEGSHGTEMGEVTLFGPCRQGRECRVTEGQQVGQVGCSPVSGRRDSGASEKEQV